ncbi:MAG: hypothetical protein K0R65_1398 [Crocinitomicaceae bacterium]|jgi:uncharacterized protein (DUF2235 family)|nr:hypothetical protein [Crocinitomicaceae bacterium]
MENKPVKRLITFSDGTWNKPGAMDGKHEVKTNVEILFNCIEHIDKEGVPQLKIYDEGVGTSSWDRKDQVMGGIAGFGIDKNIMDVYTFLVINYEIGSEIYLFGFSRGAYTARSLAGFIHNCGILKAENIGMINEAYELYRDRNKYSHPDSDFMTTFRKKYCVEPATKIHYIGVWDTVGALGLPFAWSEKHNTERYKFHDVKLSRMILNAYHALAVDERRKQFTPTLWEKSAAVKEDPNHPQVLRQRWFAGVHSNVGGGYADHGLSDIALGWLAEGAKKAGLSIDINKSKRLFGNYEFKPDYKGKLRNSLKWYYRLTLSAKQRGIMVKRYNNKGELMVTCEEIDETVVQRYHDKSMGYTPKNLRNYFASLDTKQASK